MKYKYRIIIIGLNPQGLAMLRMLSRAGFEVIAFTSFWRFRSD